jgi:hypothetical protein
MLIPVKPFTKGPARYYYEADASQSWQACAETGFGQDMTGNIEPELLLCESWRSLGLGAKPVCRWQTLFLAPRPKEKAKEPKRFCSLLWRLN